MTFEFDGEKYRAASAHQKEWGGRLIAEMRFRGDERILDLGCGDGALTRSLADLSPRGFVLGIDASRGMIDSARKHEKENLKFELADIREISFENEFDLVFSNAALHWIKDHRGLLAGVYKCLKPGGIARFNFASEGNCRNFFTVIRKVMAREEYAASFREFDWPWYMPGIEEYGRLVREFPFAEIKFWGENADRYFADREAMIAWIDVPSLVPFLPCLPESERAQFRERAIAEMLALSLQPDRTCFETFRRVNLLARK
ncbi:MAG: methyltransferase type 11 [Candidatus Glassbacteria bacterium RIFCSPLOWO2_12_FULL_58_11]|uniref:Methyltransferase type 11 n=1 Tax=Candidatus Glassbacteria bacterium RIFCSPLOWO2_12_FULL_58_11 TaxID=1817867 RepID=A0A1F5YME7_9BACT|nr:MAG: methyltransferase type 11 [Candidatus Glassbacteria bacterium RIFCSPLOWO2_12_FULL_58_11]